MVEQIKCVWYYDYSGGHYYYDYADAFKKEYDGFAQVTITDEEGNVTKHFFHQSEFSFDNAESEIIGEYQDHISKKGRIYRTETYDDSGNLFTASIQKWDKTQLADDDPNNDRFFPFLARKTIVQYDGNLSARSKASEFVYGEFGNVTTSADYGEVVAIDLTNPQSLNKYSYVMNNPLKYVDPTGNEPMSFFAICALATAYGPEIASTIFGSISTAGAVAGLKEAVKNQVGMVKAYLKNNAKGVQEKADAQKGTFFKQLAGQFSNLS